ncbi:hypothetical protein [Methyloceanibacter sp.]|uniref:hypothetical protein n=1 Tax=Methyloceanibacter sp. TaxID=1965321 RepID=UPI002BA1CA5E|nr:hypothetical protein [Methyloceanibacter sp.]HML91668.1 hypothetical protein [Methyloceanibacter sp.]
MLRKFAGSIEKGGCPLEKYLKKHGKPFVENFCRYQKYQIDASDICPERYYILSYEKLSFDYEAAAKDLLEYRTVNLPDEQFEAVAKSGSFSQRDSGPGKFIRKGKVHAFSDDLTERGAAYLLELAAVEDLRDTKVQMATFDPSLTPYLEMTDVGL